MSDAATESVKRSMRPGADAAHELAVIADEAAPAIVAGAEKNRGGVLDGMEDAVNKGWNAQMFIPVAGGAAGWLLKKGASWGPVLGAPLRAAGHVLGAPQKIMNFEVQDAAHLKSASLFRKAQKYTAAAERPYEKMLQDLQRAEEALKGDSFSGLRETLATARNNLSNAYDEAATIRTAAGDVKTKTFSTNKAGELDTRAVIDAFNADIENIAGKGAAGTGTIAQETLTKAQLKALEKAKAHMARFSANAEEMQKHAVEAGPLRAEAKILEAEETARKNAFIASAEEKLRPAATKVEEAVAGNRILSRARETVASYFSNRAEHHAKNAATRQAKGLGRLNTAIAALEDPKFSELREKLETAKKTYGEIPKTKDPVELKKMGDEFGDAQKNFSEAVARFKNENKGSLSKKELKALESAETNFSGKLMGVWGAGKGFIPAHESLEAQGLSESKAAFARDMKAGIEELPKAFSKASLEKGLTPALYGVAQAAAVGRSAQLSATGFKEFREVATALNDGKKVPFLKALAQLTPFVQAEEPVKMARREFWKNVTPRVIGYAAGAGAFHKAMERGGNSVVQMAFFAAQMGAVNAGEMVGSRHQFLDAAHKAIEAEKHGQKLEAGAYAGMYIMAHKADKLPESDPALAVVSKRYAEENIPVAQALRDITSGKFTKTVAAAHAELAAQAAAAPKSEAAASQPQAETAQATPSAQSRLQQANTEQPAMGKHTLKENARRVGKAALVAGDAANLASFALD